MSGGIRKSTKKLTLCAVCCALGVVIMSLGSLFEVLDLSSSALAAMLIVFIVIEIGGFWPWLVYAATGLLALMLPLKLAAVFYLVFVGYYPILKAKIERSGRRALGWAVKLALFIAALAAGLLISKYFLMIPDISPPWTAAVFIVGTAAFVLFDIALTKLIILYLRVWRRRLRIDRLL